MSVQSRREFLGIVASGVLSAHALSLRAAEPEAAVTFSFGTYGMPKLKAEEALRIIAGVGYDGVELAVRSDWDSAPEKMSAERRRAVRSLLRDTGLKLTALMEHLPITRDPRERTKTLERLAQAAALGHDLAPDAPPLIQTVLGGGKWDDLKALYRDRLAEWADVGRRTETVIAIKPHRGGAMSRPEEAIWLIEQLDRTPWLRMVYDYSHYAYRDLPLEQTVRTALPWTAHIAIKDAVRNGEQMTFALPGASGQFDYAPLFRLLKEGGYSRDICCEVSSQVSSRPGYDPLAAAKTCYRNIAPVFKAVGLKRAHPGRA